MEKLCLVCGDNKSVGVNYRGQTCESCKTFFQRCALKQQTLQCYLVGKCQIDIGTRRCCSKCRLDKCFAIGMILNKKNKSTDLVLATNLNQNHLDDNKNVTKLIENIIIENIGFSRDNNEHTLHSQSTRKRKHYATNLTLAERSLLSELENATSVFIDESTLPVVGRFFNVMQSCNLPILYAKFILKFLKSLSAFNILCPADQLKLLKKSYIKILGYRLVFLFDLETGGYPVISNELGTEAMFVDYSITKDFTRQDLVKENRRFVELLNREMENDTTIRDLIIALNLFQQQDGLVAREFVLYQYHIYARLLRHYLEQKYANIQQANRKFGSLLNVADQYDEMVEKSRVMFDELDITQFSGLLIELYDLVEK